MERAAGEPEGTEADEYPAAAAAASSVELAGTLSSDKAAGLGVKPIMRRTSSPCAAAAVVASEAASWRVGGARTAATRAPRRERPYPRPDMRQALDTIRTRPGARRGAHARAGRAGRGRADSDHGKIRVCILVVAVSLAVAGSLRGGRRGGGGGKRGAEEVILTLQLQEQNLARSS